MNLDIASISLILNLFILISMIIVGLILRQQIKSQNERIQSMKTVVESITEYSKIFDLEVVKKYVKGKEELMNQDTELLRRKIIKETTHKTAIQFSKLAEERMSKVTSLMINDLTMFTYWFFNTHMNDGHMEEHLEAMFPNIHTHLIKYFEELKKEDKK